MTVKELTQEQLDELKWAMFFEEENEEIIALVGEAETHDEIPNAAVEKAYADTFFSNDDFYCSRTPVMCVGGES